MPDINQDGWRLDDGEARALESPTTFFIPHTDIRHGLQPGDFAKLIFEFLMEDGSFAYERMWVIVRASVQGIYIGILNNEPDIIEMDESFRVGMDVPFLPKHIIHVMHANPESILAAQQPPEFPWQ